MTLARTFRSRLAADAHRADVTARYSLPRHYSRADIDDGTIVERGVGRHVPPGEIVREQAPAIHISPTGKTWAVESTESERADAELAPLLTEHDLGTWDADAAAKADPLPAAEVTAKERTA